MTSEASDHELIERYQRGAGRVSEDAFEKLMKRYQQSTYMIALNVLKDPDDAEDARQEAWQSILERLETLQLTNRTAAAWIMKTAQNKAIDIHRRIHCLRRKNPGPTQVNHGLEAELPDPNPPPDEAAAARETRARTQELVNRCILQLDPKYRDPLLLREIEGLSYEEIGARLTIPVGTAKSRVSRGINLLQILLEPHVGSAPDPIPPQDNAPPTEGTTP